MRVNRHGGKYTRFAVKIKASISPLPAGTRVQLESPPSGRVSRSRVLLFHTPEVCWPLA